MKRYILFPLLAVVITALAAQAESRENAQTYIHSRQFQDGSYGYITTARDTAEISDILLSVEGQSAATNQAIDYLSAYQGALPDYTARTIALLNHGGRDVSGQLNSLAPLQNPGGGWGIAAGYASDPLDTALAVEALAPFSQYQQVTQSAITYLITSQNTDGGWGPAGEESGSTIKVTMQVIRALLPFSNQHAVTTAINAAQTYLLSQRQQDGSFGTFDDPLLDTAMATYALLISGSEPSVYFGPAYQYIAARQLDNGSFNNDPFTTAWCLRILINDKPDLTVVNLDFPQVNEGDTAAFTADIYNMGNMPATTFEVRIVYRAAGQPDLDIVEPFEVSPITGPFMTYPISASFNTLGHGGDGQIVVMTDIYDQIEELDKTNNDISLVIHPTKLTDLEIMPANIVFSNPYPYATDTQTITIDFSNVGELPSGPFAVKVYDGKPGTGQFLGEITSDLPAGGIGELTLSGPVTIGTHNISVTLDESNAVRESNKSNNSTSRAYTVFTKPPDQLSNLVADSMSVLPATDLKLHEAATLACAYHNEGPAASDATLAGLYIGGPMSTIDQASLVETLPIGALAAGGSSNVTFTWTPTEGNRGGARAWIKLDPYDSMSESNESDNAVTEYLKINDPNLADLEVSELTFPTNPQHFKDEAPVSVRLKNIGAVGIANARVEIRLYNSEREMYLLQQDIPWIPQGYDEVISTVFQTINRRDMIGTFTLSARVTTNNPENDPTNDEVTGAMIVEMPQQPDMAVTNMWFDPAEPNSGDEVTIYARVENQGVMDASNFTVRFSNGFMEGGGELLNNATASLAPGDAVTLEATLNTTGLIGSQIIVVKTDPDNQIVEIFEDNNEQFKNLTVHGNDVAVYMPDIQFDPRLPLPSEPFVILVDVRNRGTELVTPEVDLYYEDNFGARTLIGSNPGVPVQPYDTALATFEWTIQPGAQRVAAVLDEANVIAEIDESNNEARRALNLIREPVVFSDVAAQPGAISPVTSLGVQDETAIRYRSNLTDIYGTVIIFNSSGGKVLTMMGNPSGAPYQQIIWNGGQGTTNYLPVADGEYTYKVGATVPDVMVEKTWDSQADFRSGARDPGVGAAAGGYLNLVRDDITMVCDLPPYNDRSLYHPNRDTRELPAGYADKWQGPFYWMLQNGGDMWVGKDIDMAYMPSHFSCNVYLDINYDDLPEHFSWANISAYMGGWGGVNYNYGASIGVLPDSPWDIHTITWDNQPSHNENYTMSGGAWYCGWCVGEFLYWNDVGPVLNGWRNGSIPYTGIAITYPDRDGVRGATNFGFNGSGDPYYQPWDLHLNVDGKNYFNYRYPHAGKWVADYDSGSETTIWQQVVWKELQRPVGTDVKVRTRTANKMEEIPTAPWSRYINKPGDPIDSLPGRFIEVEITLISSDGKTTPVIDSVTVIGQGMKIPDLHPDTGWTSLGVVMANSSSPSVVQTLENSYRLYYVDHQTGEIRSAISNDGEKWSAEGSIGISGNDPEALLQRDGSTRLYYTTNGMIVSALSQDGRTYTDDPGIRLSIQTPFTSISSPKIVPVGVGKWRMYLIASDGSSTGVASAVSSDGLEWTFEEGWRIPPGALTNGGSIVGFAAGYTQEKGYEGFLSDNSGNVWGCFSVDGYTWRIGTANLIADGAGASLEFLRLLTGTSLLLMDHLGDITGYAASEGGLVIVDNTPPQVEILDPDAQNVIKDSSVAVSGRVNDQFPSIYTVSLQNDHGQSITISSQDISSSIPKGILASIDTEKFENGPYNLILSARDQAGNESTTSIPVLIDNTSPIFAQAPGVPQITIPGTSPIVTDLATGNVGGTSDYQTTVELFKQAGSSQENIQPVEATWRESSKSDFLTGEATGLDLRYGDIRLGSTDRDLALNRPVDVGYIKWWLGWNLPITWCCTGWYSYGCPAYSAMVDGLTDSGPWLIQNGWIMVDLGAEYDIASFSWKNDDFTYNDNYYGTAKGYVTDYLIGVSTAPDYPDIRGNEILTTIGQMSAGEDGHQRLPHPVRGRYVRLYTPENWRAGPKLNEFRVFGEYPGSGTYVSKIFDFGSDTQIDTVQWSETAPAGATVSATIRMGQTSAPDASWSGWIPVQNGLGAQIPVNGRYAQYQFVLTQDGSQHTPQVDNIKIHGYWANWNKVAEVNVAGGSAPSAIFTDTSGADFLTGVTQNTTVANNGYVSLAPQISLENFALGRPVTSDIPYNTTLSRLVDGVLDYGDGANGEGAPIRKWGAGTWIQVDLGSVRDLSRIHVVNAYQKYSVSGCYESYMVESWTTGFQAYVSETGSLDDYQLVYTGGFTGPGGDITIDVPGVKGRYIKIIPDWPDYWNRSVSLAELEVFGWDYPSSGQYVSSVHDLGPSPDVMRTECVTTIPDNTGLTVDIRSGSSSVPDSTWTPWTTAQNHTKPDIEGQFFQYRATFSSNYVHATPVFDSLSLVGKGLPGQFSFPGLQFDPGNNQYAARARGAFDVYSPLSDPVTINYVNPELPPIAELSIPSTGSIVKCVILIKGTALDLVDFRDYTVAVSKDNGATWTNLTVPPVTSQVNNGMLAVWDTNQFDDGVYQVRLQVRDSKRMSVAEVQKVIVDNKPPSTPVIMAPTVAGSPITVTNKQTVVTGLAPVGSKVELNKDNMLIDTVTVSQQGEFTSTNVQLTEGLNVIWARAIDEAGTASANSDSIQVTLDTFNLTASFPPFLNPMTTATVEINLSSTVDPTGIYQVTISLDDNVGYETHTETTSGVTLGNHLIPWTVGAFPDGNYTVTVKACSESNLCEKVVAPVVIAPDLRLIARVYPDKTEVHSNETINISADLTSQSVNHVFKNLLVKLDVVGPAGDTVKSFTGQQDSLYPGGHASLIFPWNSYTNSPGNYRMLYKVYENSSLITDGEGTPVSILSDGKLDALMAILNVIPAYAKRWDDVKIPLALRNIGNTDVVNADISVLVASAKTGDKQFGQNWVVSLRMTETSVVTAETTAGWSEGYYLVAAMIGTEERAQKTLTVDGTAPTVTMEVGIPSSQQQSYLYITSSTPITLNGKDEISGIDHYEHSVDQIAFLGGRVFTLTGEGPHLLTYRAVDRSGNIGSDNIDVWVDNTSPIIAVDVSDPKYLATEYTTDEQPAAVYYINDDTYFFVFTQDDAVGLRRIEYRVDEQDWVETDIPDGLIQYYLWTKVDYGDIGRHVVDFKAIDLLGNESEMATFNVIYNDPPAIEISNLQTDKPSYVPGDSIHTSAVLANHAPSTYEVAIGWMVSGGPIGYWLYTYSEPILLLPGDQVDISGILWLDCGFWPGNYTLSASPLLGTLPVSTASVDVPIRRMEAVVSMTGIPPAGGFIEGQVNTVNISIENTGETDIDPASLKTHFSGPNYRWDWKGASGPLASGATATIAVDIAPITVYLKDQGQYLATADAWFGNCGSSHWEKTYTADFNYEAPSVSALLNEDINYGVVLTNTGDFQLPLTIDWNVPEMSIAQELAYTLKVPVVFGASDAITFDTVHIPPETPPGAHSMDLTFSIPSGDARQYASKFEVKPLIIDARSLTDKLSYRVGDTINLTAEMTISQFAQTLTGSFQIDIPDINIHTTSQVIFESSGATKHAIFPISIPPSINSGSYPINCILSFPNGQTRSWSNWLQIRSSRFTLTLQGDTFSAGDTLPFMVTNVGGVDSSYSATVTISGAGAFKETFTSTGDARAGEGKNFSIKLQDQYVSGDFLVSGDVVDNKTNLHGALNKVIHVLGASATLNVRTDKDNYISYEPVTGLGTLTNGQVGLANLDLHHQVVRLGYRWEKSVLPQEEWPSARHDPANTGVSLLPGNFRNGVLPNTLWSRDDIQPMSSPVVADIDGDGVMEVIVEGKMWSKTNVNNFTEGLFVMDGLTGVTKWSYTSECASTFPCLAVGGGPSPVIADVDPFSPGKEVIVGSGSQWGGEQNGLFVFSSFGTLLHPIDTNYPVSTPGAADLNGDGYAEVVFGTADPAQQNWGEGPFILDLSGTSPIVTPCLDTTLELQTGMTDAPAFADINDDGKIEFIAGFGRRYSYPYEGGVHAFDSNGNMNWSYLGGPGQTFGSYAVPVFGSPVIGDIDNDPSNGLEVIYQGSGIIVLSASTGKFLWFKPEAEGAEGSAPVLANLTGGPGLDIVVNNGNAISVLDSDGTEKWTRTLGYQGICGSPSVFDANGDGQLDIVVSDCYQSDTLFALNGSNGDLLWSVPDNTTFATAIADMDGDGIAEIIASLDYRTGGSLIALAGPGSKPTDSAQLVVTDVYYDRHETLGVINPSESHDINEAIGSFPADARGKLYYMVTATTSSGQQLAKAYYPFYVEDGSLFLTLNPSATNYPVGAPVHAEMHVKNLGQSTSTGLRLELTAEDQHHNIVASMQTEYFDLDAGAERIFTWDPILTSAGKYRLLARLTASDYPVAEAQDFIQLVAPVILVKTSAPQTVGPGPFPIGVSLQNEGLFPTDITVNLDDHIEPAHPLHLEVHEIAYVTFERSISQDTTFTVEIRKDYINDIVLPIHFEAEPDLMVTLTPDSHTYLAGAPIHVDLHIENISQSVEYPSFYAWALNNDGESVESTGYYYAKLDPGAGITQPWDFTINSPGMYLLNAEGYFSYCYNCAYSNGRASDIIQVVSPVVPPVANITASATAPDTAGPEPFEIIAILTNSGAKAGDVTVNLSDHIEPDRSIHLESGGYELVTFERSITTDTTFTVEVRGDYTEEIPLLVHFVPTPIAKADIEVTADSQYPEGWVEIPFTVTGLGIGDWDYPVYFSLRDSAGSLVEEWDFEYHLNSANETSIGSQESGALLVYLAGGEYTLHGETTGDAKDFTIDVIPLNGSITLTAQSPVIGNYWQPAEAFYTINNSAFFGGDFNATFVLSQGSTEISRSEIICYIPANGDYSGRLDFFDLQPGVYTLTSSLQPGGSTSQVVIQVLGLSGEIIDLSVSMGAKDHGHRQIDATVDLTAIYPYFSGYVTISTPFWNDYCYVDLSDGVTTTQTCSFNMDYSMVNPGSYELDATLGWDNGQIVKTVTIPFDVTGPVFEATPPPSGAIFEAGSNMSFAFSVVNVGDQESDATLDIDVPDPQFQQSKTSSFTFDSATAEYEFISAIPAEIPAGYKVAKWALTPTRRSIHGLDRGIIPFRIEGLSVDATTSLDRPLYRAGETAQLTLDVINASPLSGVTLEAQVDYQDQRQNQTFVLPTTDIPLQFSLNVNNFDDPSANYTISFPSGEKLAMGYAFIQERPANIQLYTDKTVYNAGDVVSVTVVATEDGPVYIEAYSYQLSWNFDLLANEPTTFQFTLPVDWPSGLDSISYSFGDQYYYYLYQIKGIWANYVGITTDRYQYHTNDTLAVDIVLQAGSDFYGYVTSNAYGPNGWFMLPSYESNFTKGLNFFQLTDTLEGVQPGEYTIDSVLYLDPEQNLFLAEGLTQIIVGDFAITDVRTDKYFYEYGYDPVHVDIDLYGSNAEGTLSLVLDGWDVVGSQDLTLDGSVTFPFDIAPADVMNLGFNNLSAAFTSGGLESIGHTYFWVQDTTPPLIQISGFEDGMIYDHDITPHIEVTDLLLADWEAVLKNQPFVNDTLVTSEASLFQLSVGAWDTSGNVSQQIKTFGIDKTPPAISFVGVENQGIYNHNVNPMVDVVENNLTSSDIRLNDYEPFYETMSYTTADGLNLAHQFEFSRALDDGFYFISAHAIDAAGHESDSVINFMVDAIPPEITISGVNEGGHYNQPVVPTVNINDLNFDEKDKIVLLNGLTFTSGDPIIADGNYTMYVQAWDAAGNYSETSVDFVIAKTAIALTVTGIEEGGLYRTDRLPVVTVIDQLQTTVALSLDGIPYSEGTPISAEGDHVFHVDAQDTAGNSASMDISFTIDKTPPALSIQNVTNGSYYNHDVSPLVTVNDLHLDVWQAFLDGTLQFHNGDIVSNQGQHTVQANAADKAGNTSQLAVGFFIDKTPPVVVISGVTDGFIYNHDVTPIATIIDTNLATSTITLNGNPFTSGTVITSEGNYTLYVSGTDLAGNRSQQTVHFTVDKTAPVIVITGVIDNTYYNHDVAPVITVTDTNLASSTITLNGNPFTSGTAITSEGNYTLYDSGTDLAGNHSQQTIHFVIDRTPPSVAITGVSGGAYYNYNVTPAITVADANLTSSTITLNGNPFTSGSEVSAEGDYDLYAAGSDKAGNHAQQAVHFVIDKTPPAFNMHVASVFYSTSLTFTPELTEVHPAFSSITITLNGVQYGSYSFGSPITLTAEGQYIITASAVDLAGNENTTTITLTIDKTAPIIQVSGITNGEYRNGSVSLLVTVIDTNRDLSHESLLINSLPSSMDQVITLVTEQTYTLHAEAKDMAGNSATPVDMTFTIDKTPPQINLGIASGYYNNAKIFTPALTELHPDHSSVTVTMNGSSVGTYPFGQQISLSLEGDYTVSGSAKDLAGNSATASVSGIVIDKTAPQITVTGVVDGTTYSSQVTPNIQITDLRLASSTITLNGAIYQSGTPITNDGTYLLEVKALDLAGNHSQVAVHFVMQRSRGLDITKKFISVPRVLFWANCTREEQSSNSRTEAYSSIPQKNDQSYMVESRCETPPTPPPSECLIKNFVEESLIEAGISYQTVNNEDDFMEDFRSGLFNVYLLTKVNNREDGEDDWDLAIKELVESANYGNGIIAIMDHPIELEDLSDVLGAYPSRQRKEETHHLQVKTMEFVVNGGRNSASNLSIKDAVVIGWYLGINNKTDPAVTLKQYGHGISSLIGFDVSIVEDNDREVAEEFLANMIYQVTPPTPFKPLALDTVQVGTNVKNNDSDIMLDGLESIPSDLKIVWSGGANLAPGGLEWTFKLAETQNVTLECGLRLPNKTGNWTLETEISYMANGLWIPYDSYPLTLSLNIGIAQEIDTAYSMVGKIKPCNSHETTALSKIKSILQSVKSENGSNINSRSYADDKIELVENAIWYLTWVKNPATGDIRLQLDRILRYWEARWYLAR